MCLTPKTNKAGVMAGKSDPESRNDLLIDNRKQE